VLGGLAPIAHALAQAHRLELPEHLGQGERGVEAVTARAGRTRANASRHLQLLRRAALIAGRRDGKRVCYRPAGAVSDPDSTASSITEWLNETPLSGYRMRLRERGLFDARTRVAKARSRDGQWRAQRSIGTQGKCSSGKTCRVGRSSAARSKAPIWKCVSVGKPALSQVKVEPHRAQKPRRVLPGVESNFAISPRVTVQAARSKATKTDAGAPLCLRQLSQWHQ
jgi:hypothetical protein